MTSPSKRALQKGRGRTAAVPASAAYYTVKSGPLGFTAVRPSQLLTCIGRTDPCQYHPPQPGSRRHQALQLPAGGLKGYKT